MATWLRRIFQDGVKTHMYPLALETRLLENWKHRGFKLHPGHVDAPANWAYDRITEGSIAAGHAGFTDETWEDFQLVKFKLSVRAREVEHYLVRLQESPERLELGRVYYKLHGCSHCLCLLPVQRERLIRLMTDRLEHAKAIAAAEATDFNQRLDEMAEHPNLKIDDRLPEQRLVRA